MKVISKQDNSRMCIICGLDNEYGLRSEFYNMEDDSVFTLFEYREQHQSYPGRVHGGLITAMLDELGFRAVWVHEPNIFSVTTTLETKYRKPVPYGQPLLGRGIVTFENRKFVKGHGEIIDIDGNILAEADMSYIKLSPEKIVGHDIDWHTEMCYKGVKDRDEIVFGGF